MTDVAFDLQTTPFCGIFRPGLVQNLWGGVRGSACRLSSSELRVDVSVAAKPPATTVPFFAASRRRGRGAISKSRAGHGSANSFFSAGAVSIAFAARQRWRTQAVHIRRVFRIALAGDAVGIAETARLHFLDRGIHRGGRRAARSRLPTFTSSFGRFGPFSLASILAASSVGLHFRRFDFQLFTLGCTVFGVARFAKMCGCCGFNFTGSTGTSGFASTFGVGVFTFGGAGGGATGISVIGCAICVVL